jgi:2-methylisocitrate lyase-like PEP mutase family enzyme
MKMNQTEKARRFAELHVKGAPLLLFNAWDAGSAKSILAAGAKAIATSSWSVAEAQGYRDGEAIPIELAEQTIARITATIDVPVSVDFEGGYSEDEGELAANTSRLLDLGVIGINFEDRVVKGSGLYDINRQARRLTAIRRAAEQKGVRLFINARTDLFLGQSRDPAQSVGEALERAKAYAAAGASGFFIPGLTNDALIGRICEGVTLPVNVMVMDAVPSNDRLSELGVSRISYGPIPYIKAMSALQQDGRRFFPRPNYYTGQRAVFGTLLPPHGIGGLNDTVRHAAQLEHSRICPKSSYQ